MHENPTRLLEQIRPYLRDDASYGRLHADVGDLMEICSWFLDTMRSNDRESLSRDDLETFLVELDVNLIDHATWHLVSLKKEVNVALEKLAEVSDDEKIRHGVA